jgi:uncharacterized glyoxalase superfamily protein PhnB
MAVEVYPMPLFVKLFVADVGLSADWYERALGFQSVYAAPGPNGRQSMNHLRLERYQDLMLLERSGEHQLARRDFVINLTYAGDLQELADRARRTGGNVEGPLETFWNTREVTITDPDGFLLTFSQLLNANRQFSDFMPPSVS